MKQTAIFRGTLADMLIMRACFSIGANVARPARVLFRLVNAPRGIRLGFLSFCQIMEWRKQSEFRQIDVLLDVNLSSAEITRILIVAWFRHLSATSFLLFVDFLFAGDRPTTCR